MLTENDSGIIIDIKVIPAAGKDAIVSYENELLKIKVKGIPEKGKANDSLLTFLAKSFSISKSNMLLIQGKTSRQKRIAILTLSKKAFLEKLQALLL